MNQPEEKFLSDLRIYRIETPNPYSALATNAYFVDGNPPTLIDTGLGTPEAYESLVAGLSRVGRQVKDIGRIILTHGHADHRALAPVLAKESGAEICFHSLATAKVIKSFPNEKDPRQNWWKVFRSMGVPERELPGLVEGPRNPQIDSNTVATSHIKQTSEIVFDNFKVRVLHTPGHSCGSVCLYDKASGILFSGDTILSGSHVTALLEIDMICQNPQYNGLKLHMDSLHRLRELDISCVLPGHGDIVSEYGAIVDELFERHKKRQRHILRALRNGRRSLYQICKSVFLFISPDDLYLALSEISGNLGILIDEGKIVTTCDGSIEYYEKA